MSAVSAHRRRIVIVGNGMAGAALAAMLTRDPSLDVTVIGGEPHAAYNRIRLSSVLAGDSTVDEIALEGSPAAVIAGERVTAVDRDQRLVSTSSDRSMGYDTLVLATGSTPITLPVPGAELAGIFTFRDLADVGCIAAAAGEGRRAVVIGGGLLGLEAADGLRRRGMSVTVVHLMPTLMERQLDEPAASILQSALEGRGIEFCLSAETEAFVGSDRVAAVRLKGGRELPADLVVVAVGVRPNATLGRTIGLSCGRGIQVDDTLRTSDPAIYAVGECIEHRGRGYGLFAPAQEQAIVCARHIAGEDVSYPGSVEATSLKVSGIALYSAGHQSAGPGDDEIVLSQARDGVYRKLVTRGDRLVGAVLLGDASDGAWYGELIAAGSSILFLRKDLIFGRQLAEAPPLAA
jgi:nitrite reductase (NADH) large subunit